jgi:DNA polymerase V
MKAMGVKNRCRIHEIPEGIDYIAAMPRMQLYLDYSARIYGIYLRYAAPEDIHVYSVDECFIDIGPYLNLYGKSAREIATMMMEAVYRETGITASAGIGTNLYLAKIAMDIVAKHAEDHIGELDEMSYRKLLWAHRPLTAFWMVGPGTERTLARYGMHTMGDVARASVENQDFLYRIFGIDAELLIDHAWGRESCGMKDIKHYRTMDHSYSNGQVLMRNYGYEEAAVVVREMAEETALDLVSRGLVTHSVYLYVGYDHRAEIPGARGTRNLGARTNLSSRLTEAFVGLYRALVRPGPGIRRICLSCGGVVPEGDPQFDLFTDWDEAEREERLMKSVLEIRARYGKNAMFRAANLLKCSTLRERHAQIGGHRA